MPHRINGWRMKSWGLNIHHLEPHFTYIGINQGLLQVLPLDIWKVSGTTGLNLQLICNNTQPNLFFFGRFLGLTQYDASTSLIWRFILNHSKFIFWLTCYLFLVHIIFLYTRIFINTSILIENGLIILRCHNSTILSIFLLLIIEVSVFKDHDYECDRIGNKKKKKSDAV